MTTNTEPEPWSEAAAGPPRREQLFELGVFLFLIVPSLVLSLFISQRGGLTFPLVAISTILRDLALVALILFFLWHNGEPLPRLGWTFRDAWRELLIGVVLFVPMTIGAGLLENFLRSAGLSTPSGPAPSYLTPTGGLQLALAIILVIVVAIAEETIFRGYLMLRIGSLTRSIVVAVVLSAVIFALGHGYEGSAGLATVGAIGAAFAIVYAWRGSLIAPIVMHFLQDFLAIVVAPLLGGR